MPTAHYCAQCLTTFPSDPKRCTNLGCGSPRPASGWGALLGPGDLLDRHYLIERVLAVGGAGLTYLARELGANDTATGPELAIKVLYAQRDNGPFLRRLATEAQILQDLNHPNIVECRGFVHRTGHAPYLVTLFEHGGTLTDHIRRVGPVPGAVAAGILKQVLLALDRAHQHDVVHRDLKPDNVLLRARVDRWDLPRVRVADFGIAKVPSQANTLMTHVGTFVGTPEYAAPEQFEYRPPTAATDIFAAGGLLYFLLTGEAPLRFEHRLDLVRSYQQVLEHIPPRLPQTCDTESVTRGLQEILDATMRANAEDRWTIRRLVEALDRLLPLAEASLEAQAEAAGPAAEPDVAADRGIPPTLQDHMATFVMGYGPGPTITPRPEDDVPTVGETLLARRVDQATRWEPLREVATVQESVLAPLGAADPPVPAADVAVPPPAVPAPPPRAENPPAALEIPASPTEKPPHVASWKDVLQALVSTPPAGRSTLLSEGGAGFAEEILKASRTHRVGGDPIVGQGLCLWIAATGRTDLANTARALLTDPDAGVRVAAATAIGQIGGAPLLAQLKRLLADPQPTVRIAAAHAVAAGCLRTRQAKLGLEWVKVLASDPSTEVRAAYRDALTRLDEG